MLVNGVCVTTQHTSRIYRELRERPVLCVLMPIVLISNADVIQFVFDRCYMQTSEFFRARSNTQIELQYIPRELLQCFGC